MTSDTGPRDEVRSLTAHERLTKTVALAQQFMPALASYTAAPCPGKRPAR